jgi:hypothetical protein
MSLNRSNHEKEIIAASIHLQNTIVETEFYSQTNMYRLAFAYGHLRMLQSMQKYNVGSSLAICGAAQTQMAQVYYGLHSFIEPRDVWKTNNSTHIYELTLPYLFSNFKKSRFISSPELYEQLQRNVLLALSNYEYQETVLDREIDELLLRLTSILGDDIDRNQRSQLAIFGMFPHNPLATKLNVEEEADRELTNA